MISCARSSRSWPAWLLGGHRWPCRRQRPDIQERTLKFPSASNKGHPQVMGVQKFAELVKEKSGGKITVKPFPGGALGPDLQTVSALQGGTVDMTVMNAGLLAGNAKEFAVLDFPICSTRPPRPMPSSTARSGRSCSTSCRRRAWSGSPTGTSGSAT